MWLLYEGYYWHTSSTRNIAGQSATGLLTVTASANPQPSVPFHNHQRGLGGDLVPPLRQNKLIPTPHRHQNSEMDFNVLYTLLMIVFSFTHLMDRLCLCVIYFAMMKKLQLRPSCAASPSATLVYHCVSECVCASVCVHLLVLLVPEGDISSPLQQ
jgi:hypothetical protein